MSTPNFMKTYKWRIVLSIGNVLLAVGMSAVGVHQYTVDHRLHPEAFYHGNLYYVPAAQWWNYCLNAPSQAVVGLAHYYVLPSGWSGFWVFYFVPYEYYVAVFLLWWWIGWRIDTRASFSRIKVAWGIVELLACLALSAPLIFYGNDGLQRGYAIPGVARSEIAWGLGLLAYSLFRISVLGKNLVQGFQSRSA